MENNIKVLDFIKNIGLFSITSAILKLVGFLIVIWIGNNLGPTEFGDWSLAYSFLTGIVTFCGVGLAEVAISNTNKTVSKEKRESEYTRIISTFLRMSFIAFFFFSILFSFYKEDLNYESLLEIFFVATGAILLSFFTLQTNLSRVEEKYNESVIFNFIAPLIAWCLGFSLIYFSFNVSFYFGFFIGLVLSFLIFSRFFLGSSPAKVEPFKNFPDINKKVIPFFYVAIFGWISGYGGNLIVAIFFSINLVGKLTLILLIGSVLQLILTAINQAWAPRFFSHLRDKKHSKNSIEEIGMINEKVYFFQSIICCLSISLILIGIFVMQSLFNGPLGQFNEYAYYILFILWGYSALLPWYQCANYLIFFDKGKELSKITITSGILGISLWIGLMYAFGEIGIYIGLLIQMILRSMFIVSFSRKIWKLRLPWFGYMLNLIIPLAIVYLLNNY